MSIVESRLRRLRANNGQYVLVGRYIVEQNDVAAISTVMSVVFCRRLREYTRTTTVGPLRENMT